MSVKNNYEEKIKELEIKNQALETLIELQKIEHKKEYKRLIEDKRELELKMQMIGEFVHPDFKLKIRG